MWCNIFYQGWFRCLHVDSTFDEVVHGCHKRVIGVVVWWWNIHEYYWFIEIGLQWNLCVANI